MEEGADRDRIQLTVDPESGAVVRLSSKLREYNLSQVPQEPPCGLLLSMEDDSGELLAGLYGHLSYSWLMVEVLWVSEHIRKQGYGKQLIKRAERYAREHGCQAVWLDTFSFQARGFYEKLGYVIFGELPNYPNGHCRYFLWKQLD